MGEMKRHEAHEVEQRTGQRFASTLVIAGAIIVAVRLARDDISRQSPRLLATVADSINLTRTILDGVLRRYPSRFTKKSSASTARIRRWTGSRKRSSPSRR